MSNFMKKPCDSCPFRHDVKPFLTDRRAEELAYATTNPYNSFTCHKTTEPDDDSGEMLVTNRSKECAGFLSMQVDNSGRCPDGFEPSELVYGDAYDMIYAYEEANEEGGRR